MALSMGLCIFQNIHDRLARTRKHHLCIKRIIVILQSFPPGVHFLLNAHEK